MAIEQLEGVCSCCQSTQLVMHHTQTGEYVMGEHDCGGMSCPGVGTEPEVLLGTARVPTEHQLWVELTKED
jgi:hypothetical protein